MTEQNFDGYKATINEIMTVRNYTLVEYIKGGMREWCICLDYDQHTREWASGTYCYTSLQAISEFVSKVNPNLVKSQDEINSGIPYFRMSEIASKVIDGLYDDGEEAATEYLKEELELNREEADYFGIREMLFPKLYKIVEVVFKRTQKATVKVAIPQDVDSACAFEYIGNEYALEPDGDDFGWDYDDEYFDYDEILDSESVRRLYRDVIWNFDDFDELER